MAYNTPYYGPKVSSGARRRAKRQFASYRHRSAIKRYGRMHARKYLYGGR